MAFAMQCCSDVDRADEGLWTHFANDLSARVCTKFSSCCACSCCRICSLTASCSTAEGVGTDMRGGDDGGRGALGACRRAAGGRVGNNFERGRVALDLGVALVEFLLITAVNCWVYSENQLPNHSR